MSSSEPDVLVIGAGPAGSLAATLLARRGHKVLVLERAVFPRFSIGEALLANTTQILQEAGLLDAVLSAGFQFKNGASFVWGDKVAEFNFADKTAAGLGFTFQVKRADFDSLLAREAARAGADVRHEVEIVSVVIEGGKPTVTTGAGEVYRPRFLLDASGFGRTLPRLLDLDRPSSFAVRTAFFCHVRDGIPAGAFDRQKGRIGILPNDRNVWTWLIPFPDGTSSLGAVVPVSDDPRSPDARLRAIIAEETPLHELMGELVTTRPIGATTGFSASVKALHGPCFALLGNAAEFLDPIFSSGITIAFRSAQLAVAALDRQLAGETVDWQREFAEPLLFGVETFRTFVTAWYDGSLLDILFFPEKDPQVHRLICSVLAGYAWDAQNPYAGPDSARRLRTLATLCRAA